MLHYISIFQNLIYWAMNHGFMAMIIYRCTNQVYFIITKYT